MVWPEGNWPARHLLFLATHGCSAYIKVQQVSEHNRNYGLTNGRPCLYSLDPFVNPLTLNLSIMTRRYGPLYGSSSSSCIGLWPSAKALFCPSDKKEPNVRLFRHLFVLHNGVKVFFLLRTLRLID